MERTLLPKSNLARNMDFPGGNATNEVGSDGAPVNKDDEVVIGLGSLVWMLPRLLVD